MYVITLRGLTMQEYAEVQAAVKALDFPLTCRIHREKYCSGAVDIRSTKKTNYHLTEIQVEALRDLAAGLHLDDRMGSVSHREEWHTCCFWQGMNYLMKTTD